jgi:hypothetical protein
MFTFLNSVILTALLAIVIPLLLHLFNKQRKKRIQFSSTFFLKMLERQRLRRLKLYQYILIIVRSLLILFLVLAFARPAGISSGNLLSKEAQTTAVIILDNAINMRRYDQSGQRFKRAKEKLQSILNQFDLDDDVFLLNTNNPANTYLRPISIHNLQCSYGNSKWIETFKRSNEIFNDNPNLNRELIIISDFQFKSDEFTKLLKDISDIRINLFKINYGTMSNVSIDSLVISDRIYEINKPINLDVFINNSSKEFVKGLELHLYVNNRRVSHHTIDLNPLQRINVPLSFQTKKSGNLNGYVEISDDDLNTDNRYFFNLKIPVEVKILFVDDLPSSFLIAALSSINENSNISIEIERYVSWARQSFNAFDIIFLSNFTNIYPTLMNRIIKFMDQGGTIIFMPGEKTTLSELNIFMRRLRYNIVFKKLITANTIDDYYTIKGLNLKHPIFEGLFVFDNVNFTRPKFFRYYDINPNIDSDVIMAFNNDAPFLIKSHNSSSSIYVFSTYIDVNWTDLQYRGIFLPLLLRLFYLGATNTDNGKKFYSPDDVIEYRLEEEVAQTEFNILSSEGKQKKVVPDVIGNKSIFIFDNLDQPGNYALIAGENQITTFSINVDTKSLTLPSIDINNLMDNNEEILLFEEQENFETAIRVARYGQEYWQTLILLALMLFVVEIFVIKKIEGRNI